MARGNIGGYAGESSATKSRPARDPRHGGYILRMLCAASIHVTAPKTRCSRSLHQCDTLFLPGCGKWWTWPGSNRRPHRCERCALPAELQALAHHLPRHVRLGNFRADLATSRARTDDLIVANDALSQLSYSPTGWRVTFLILAGVRWFRLHAVAQCSSIRSFKCGGSFAFAASTNCNCSSSSHSVCEKFSRFRICLASAWKLPPL